MRNRAYQIVQTHIKTGESSYHLIDRNISNCTKRERKIERTIANVSFQPRNFIFCIIWAFSGHNPHVPVSAWHDSKPNMTKSPMRGRQTPWFRLGAETDIARSEPDEDCSHSWRKSRNGAGR